MGSAEEELTAEVERLRAAILDIDAHATSLGEDADGFVSGGYLISVGCLHRALGLIGHTAPPCRHCVPASHDCTPVGRLTVETERYRAITASRMDGAEEAS